MSYRGRYRQGRQWSGLSMGQASRLMGIDLVDLSSIETGKATPTPSQSFDMAVSYGFSEEWLSGDADPVVPDNIRKMLRDAEPTLSPNDRDVIIDFIGALNAKVDKRQA